MVYKVADDGVSLDSELEHDGDICDITFCHHGKFLLVGTKKDIYSVWDFAERKKIKDLKGVAFTNQLLTNFRAIFAPDNHAVALMGDGKKVFIYDTAQLLDSSPQDPSVVLEADTKSVSISWSPDCKKLLIGAWYETIVMDVESKTKIAKFQISAWNNHAAGVIDPVWLNDNTVVGKYDQSNQYGPNVCIKVY